MENVPFKLLVNKVKQIFFIPENLNSFSTLFQIDNVPNLLISNNLNAEPLNLILNPINYANVCRSH